MRSGNCVTFYFEKVSFWSDSFGEIIRLPLTFRRCWYMFFVLVDIQRTPPSQPPLLSRRTEESHPRSSVWLLSSADISRMFGVKRHPSEIVHFNNRCGLRKYHYQQVFPEIKTVPYCAKYALLKSFLATICPSFTPLACTQGALASLPGL